MYKHLRLITSTVMRTFFLLAASAIFTTMSGSLQAASRTPQISLAPEVNDAEPFIFTPLSSKQQLSFIAQMKKIDDKAVELVIAVKPHSINIKPQQFKLKRNAEINELLHTWGQQKKWYRQKSSPSFMINYAWIIECEAFDKEGNSLGKLPRQYAWKTDQQAKSSSYQCIENAITGLNCFPKITP